MIKFDPTEIGLLRKAAGQFRFYEKNHRAKAATMGKLAASEDLVRDTLAKADVNHRMAAEIEDFLAEYDRRLALEKEHTR